MLQGPSRFQRHCANATPSVSPRAGPAPNLHGALCTLIAVTSSRLPPQWLKSRAEGRSPASDAAQLTPLLPARTKAPGSGSGCRMRLLFEAAVLCLTLGLGHGTEDTTQENAAQQSSSTESYFPEWGIGAIRDSFETVNSYFDSFLELLGGKNGVCQYRCRYGK